MKLALINVDQNSCRVSIYVGVKGEVLVFKKIYVGDMSFLEVGEFLSSKNLGSFKVLVFSRTAPLKLEEFNRSLKQGGYDVDQLNISLETRKVRQDLTQALLIAYILQK